MKQASLRSVTLKTIENYRHAAEQTVEAYRASGKRLIRAVDRNLDRTVYKPAEKLAPRVNQRLQRARARLTDFANQGLDRLSATTGRAIEFGSTTAATQVTRTAERVDQIDNRYVATGLKTAAQMSMTGARLALAVSHRLADGADKLSKAAAGHARPTPKPAVKPAVKRAARPARAKVQAAPVKAAASRKAVRAKAAPKKRAPRKSSAAATSAAA